MKSSLTSPGFWAAALWLLAAPFPPLAFPALVLSVLAAFALAPLPSRYLWGTALWLALSLGGAWYFAASPWGFFWLLGVGFLAPAPLFAWAAWRTLR